MKLTEQYPFLILLLITHILHINITNTTVDNQTIPELNKHCVINNEHTPKLLTESPLSNNTYNTNSKNTSEYSNTGVLYITYTAKEHPEQQKLITLSTSDINALSSINIIPRIYNEPGFPTSQLSITAENNLIVLDFNCTIFITSVVHNLLPITQYIPTHTAQYTISNNNLPLHTAQYTISNNPSSSNKNESCIGWNAQKPDLTRNALFYDHSAINNDHSCTAINPLNITQSPISNASIMRMPLLPTPYTQYNKHTPAITRKNSNGMPPCIPGHNFILLPGNNNPRFMRHRSISKNQKNKNSSELNTQCVKSSAHSPKSEMPDENHATTTHQDTKITGVPPIWKNASTNTIKWDSLD